MDKSNAPGVVNGKEQPDYDVLIIGAGMSGIFSVVRMKELGLRTKVIERGTGPGGVWYWNRYPGARFDCESYIYGFTFDRKILDEWDWKEHFSAQKDTEEYINFLVDQTGIQDAFQFDTEIKSAYWQESSRFWLLTDTTGHCYTSRFLINALGPLTAHTLPNIPGVSDYKGLSCHSSRWPKEEVSFEGKRVGLIGTGATGVQIAQEVAKTAEQFTIFQRTANWAVPMRNKALSAEDMADIRRRYTEIHTACKSSPQGFHFGPDPRNTFDIPKEEREAFWESLYSRPGLVKWVGNFKDLYRNQAANDEYSAWVANKIRQRVNNPATAEKLIPKSHGFGTRRVSLETNYFEVYNQENVRLVDLKETPIEKITEKGIKTSEEDLEFDILIYATGFNPVIGAYEDIDYQGENGLKLKEKWADGPKSYLGLNVSGFPNMFTVLGPHHAAGNLPNSIETAVNWVHQLIKYMSERGFTYEMADEEGELEWTKHCNEVGKGLLALNVDSWQTGVNHNVPGKQKRTIPRYFGTNIQVRQWCSEEESRGYPHFRFNE
ncbi:hypothetical protein N7530_008327 [Penicillium desertorum]|uniref:FAD/NAD(P)-binding domain-containing protein n=1 Tax=Penicillium desertorum TaxID=1303715 RepID=A0A9W9WNW0_9EURO|nr:hypothetical protein N7530_008327 [Penicillium desertorum]